MEFEFNFGLKSLYSVIDWSHWDSKRYMYMYIDNLPWHIHNGDTSLALLQEQYCAIIKQSKDKERQDKHLYRSSPSSILL